MPRPADPFVEHCRELLGGIGTVRVARMFGGHGLYVDAIFVALVAGDTLYLKTDAATTPAFEAAGCHPFAFEARGKRVVTGYRSAPDAALESADQMQPWARLALEAALRARAAKRASPRRKSAAAAPAKKAKPRLAAAKTSARPAPTDRRRGRRSSPACRGRSRRCRHGRA